MRYIHLTRNRYHCPVINLDKLWSLVSDNTKKAYKSRDDGKAPIIDVVRAVSKNTTYIRESEFRRTTSSLIPSNNISTLSFEF